MVLSNAERQARHRERLKQLVAKGVMAESQIRILTDTRRLLRGWRRSLAAYAEGRMNGLTRDGVNVTDEHFEMVRKLIVQNDVVIAKFDPENLTADGNIEIGAVGPEESSGVLAGRWVAYSLDGDGCAVELGLYDAESHARTDALLAGRYAGVIADDGWSISPPGE